MMNLYDVASTSEVSRYCFELFTRTSDQGSKDELQRLIKLADNLGEAVLGTEVYISGVQQDAVSENVGTVVLNELSNLELVVEEDVSPERQRLIDSFDKGIDAFFPEGISTSYRTELFILADTAYGRPNGKSEENTVIYESRKKLIFELLEKTYDSQKFYHGVSVVDLFETADWLYGGSEDQHEQQGWSIDPRLPYQLNPQLLRYDKETIQSTSTSFSEHVGIPVPTLLTSAARGNYRYLQSPEAVQQEIIKLKELGIDNAALKRRPDILNYPLKVLQQKEKDYIAMGVPKAVVRSTEKFFVYKTETIKERIDLLDVFIDKLESTVLDKESAELAKQTVRENKSLMLEFGKDRIKSNTGLVLQYAHDYNWNEAVEEASILTNDALKSVIYNMLKAKPDELKKYMELNPNENIYRVARKLVHKSKTKKK